MSGPLSVQRLKPNEAPINLGALSGFTPINTSQRVSFTMAPGPVIVHSLALRGTVFLVDSQPKTSSQNSPAPKNVYNTLGFPVHQGLHSIFRTITLSRNAGDLYNCPLYNMTVEDTVRSSDAKDEIGIMASYGCGLHPSLNMQVLPRAVDSNVVGSDYVSVLGGRFFNIELLTPFGGRSLDLRLLGGLTLSVVIGTPLFAMQSNFAANSNDAIDYTYPQAGTINGVSVDGQFIIANQNVAPTSDWQFMIANNFCLVAVVEVYPQGAPPVSDSFTYLCVTENNLSISAARYNVTTIQRASVQAIAQRWYFINQANVNRQEYGAFATNAMSVEDVILSINGHNLGITFPTRTLKTSAASSYWAAMPDAFLYLALVSGNMQSVRDLSAGTNFGYVYDESGVGNFMTNPGIMLQTTGRLQIRNPFDNTGGFYDSAGIYGAAVGNGYIWNNWIGIAPTKNERQQGRYVVVSDTADDRIWAYLPETKYYGVTGLQNGAMRSMMTELLEISVNSTGAIIGPASAPSAPATPPSMLATNLAPGESIVKTVRYYPAYLEAIYPTPPDAIGFKVLQPDQGLIASAFIYFALQPYGFINHPNGLHSISTVRSNGMIQCGQYMERNLKFMQQWGRTKPDANRGFGSLWNRLDLQQPNGRTIQRVYSAEQTMMSSLHQNHADNWRSSGLLSGIWEGLTKSPTNNAQYVSLRPDYTYNIAADKPLFRAYIGYNIPPPLLQNIDVRQTPALAQHAYAWLGQATVVNRETIPRVVTRMEDVDPIWGRLRGTPFETTVRKYLTLYYDPTGTALVMAPIGGGETFITNKRYLEYAVLSRQKSISWDGTGNIQSTLGYQPMRIAPRVTADPAGLSTNYVMFTQNFYSSASMAQTIEDYRRNGVSWTETQPRMFKYYQAAHLVNKRNVNGVPQAENDINPEKLALPPLININTFNVSEVYIYARPLRQGPLYPLSYPQQLDGTNADLTDDNVWADYYNQWADYFFCQPARTVGKYSPLMVRIPYATRTTANQLAQIGQCEYREATIQLVLDSNRIYTDLVGNIGVDMQLYTLAHAPIRYPDSSLTSGVKCMERHLTGDLLQDFITVRGGDLAPAECGGMYCLPFLNADGNTITTMGIAFEYAGTNKVDYYAPGNGQGITDDIVWWVQSNQPKEAFTPFPAVAEVANSTVSVDAERITRGLLNACTYCEMVIMLPTQVTTTWSPSMADARNVQDSTQGASM